ncbi:hypothetical protein FACS189418_8180 [Clostridia bacterium]|nr:hypothetical protein FACS189418_8180 [Clostridia bacterium]
MKLKHLKYAVLSVFTICTIILITTKVSAASPTHPGFLDAVSANAIAGWGMDPARPSESYHIHIYIYNGITNQQLALIPIQADQFRSDLAQNNIGTGNYGFILPIDWSSLPGAELYRIDAYLVNNRDNPKLQNSLTYSPTGYKGTATQKSLGTFTATAYCPCTQCSGKSKLTATGTVPKAKHTISVDPKVVPFGSKLLIDGVVYTAEDRGGGVKGNHVDIFFNTHAEALRYGRKKVQVYLIP